MTRHPIPAGTACHIGILGGTFNPIHYAHLHSAEEVCETQALDRVLFIPSASPPHKEGTHLASAEHRLAMVRLAVAGNRRFRASAIELERSGRSYSVDTLRSLKESRPRAHFTFIIGLDAFSEIGTWKEYQTLFGLCDIVVTSRPKYEVRHLRSLLPVAARRDFCYSPDTTTLVHRSGHRVRFQRIRDLDISATDLRERIQAGLSIRYLVPEAVVRYIARHQLYLRRPAAW